MDGHDRITELEDRRDDLDKEISLLRIAIRREKAVKAAKVEGDPEGLPPGFSVRKMGGFTLMSNPRYDLYIGELCLNYWVCEDYVDEESAVAILAAPAWRLCREIHRFYNMTSELPNDPL